MRGSLATTQWWAFGAAVAAAGCAATVHNRVVIQGRAAFAPERARAHEYARDLPDPHEGLEREIADSLVRLSPTPLRTDGLLHGVGETLFHEVGRDFEFPSDEVREFAIRWHGLTEMDVDLSVFEASYRMDLTRFVAGRMQRALSEVRDDGIAYNSIAVVVGKGGRAGTRRALILLSARYCELESVPERVERGASLRLRGRLLAPFDHPVVVLTRADGRVERRPVGLTREIDAEIPTDQRGALQVEVVGSFRYGPKPIANFPIWIGEKPPGYAFLEDAPERSSAEAARLEMIRLVNDARSRHGLRALAVDHLLGRVAKRYSKEMRQHHFFGHHSPRSGTPQDRVERAGYQGSVGENIAGNYRSARAAHEWLMASPGHAANILDPDATHLGVGVIGHGPASDRRYTITELFGHLLAWSSWSVEERASRLAEMAAHELGIDPSSLDEVSGPPRSEPASAGRVAALRALALVEMSRDHLDRADAIVRHARAPSGTAPLAVEIARRRAPDPDAARAAVVGVLRQVPPGHVDSALLPMRRYSTGADLDGWMRSLQLSEPSLGVLSDAVEISVVWRPMVEHHDLYEAALAEIRTENERSLPSRRHSFPELRLEGATDASEVVVAVWNRGVRAESFPGRVFESPTDSVNGRDDDGNGQVDDVHGVVAPNAGSNEDLLGSEAREAAGHQEDLRGSIDSSCGLWTADTERNWRRLDAATGVEREALSRRLRDLAGWALGTHDASVLLEGNPFARLAVFRSQWRPPLTDAAQAVEGRHVAAIADFVRRHRIRVVLAPTALSLESIADDLRQGDDLSLSEGAVRARARVVLDRARDRWKGLLDLCPDTLFVVPSGSGRDDDEVPTSLDAANLLVVGSVDELGYPSSCPGSSGERVAVQDLGVGVEGLLPSGARLALSGTSHSAARVANLAAKLIALDPNLTPARVIAGIVETADPVAGRYRGRIANAAHAAARVRRERRAQAR